MSPPGIARRALLLAVSAALFALVVVVSALTATPDGWRDSVRWAELRCAQLAVETMTCPALVGPGGPGDARTRYLHAARLAGTVDPVLRQRLRQLAAGGAPEAGQLPLALVAQLPPAARDELRAAARADGAVFAATAVDARSDDGDLYELDAIIDGLLVTARFAADEHERLVCWLDALASGVDLAGHESLAIGSFGAFMVTHAVESATAAWLLDLSATALATLAPALATADRAFSVEVRPELTAIAWVRHLEAGNTIEPIDLGMASSLQAWRHGFSLQHAALARAQALVDATRRFGDGTRPGEPWSERRRRLEQLDEWDAAQTADVAWRDLGNVLELETMRRRAAARLRLLRQAVQFRLGRPIPELADPLGDGPLQVAIDGDRMHGESAVAECAFTVSR